MIPVHINPARVSVALVGAGDRLGRRCQQLREAGATDSKVFVVDGEVPEGVTGANVFTRMPGQEELVEAHLVYVAGLDDGTATQVAKQARDAGALVNVEDVLDQCDFHQPGIVRRGDLLLTVGTGGKSPGLARRLRQWLQARFGDEWAARVDELAAARNRWIEQGESFSAVAQRTNEMIEERGWLK